MPPKKKKTKSATLADVQDTPEFPVGEESDGDSCGSASSLDSMMVIALNTYSLQVIQLLYEGLVC